jgi:hypothetical protein
MRRREEDKLRKEDDNKRYRGEATIFRLARIASYITVGLLLALIILAVIALILAISYFIFNWIVPSVMDLVTPDGSALSLSTA